MPRFKLTRLSALLTLALSPWVATGASANEIVLATWGGTWGQAIQENAINQFQEKTGIKVRVISGVSLANMQMIAAQKANPQVDIIMMVSQDAMKAYDDGLLEPLKGAEIPNLDQIKPMAVRKDKDGNHMFAGMWLYPYGFAYRTDKIKDDVKCWKDLWDPKFRNKVGVSSPKYMNGYFLLMANKMAGGTEADVRPGVDLIKKMGQNLVATIDDSASQQRLLAQGEVWAVPMLSSAALRMVDQGVEAKFVIPCEGAPAGLDVIALVKNAPHSADAKKFINFYIDSAVAQKVTEALKITPVNAKVTPSPEHAKHTVSDADLARLLSFSDKAINEQRPAWQEMWEREISPMTRR
jgi:putative spermidine/putrescine transport system substrate-binding protein